MKYEIWEEKLDRWLQALENGKLDASLTDELKTLIARSDDRARYELEERFYKELEFGTSGLRGLIGAGTNRINVHTVRKIMQGICDYINSEAHEATALSVALAYDSRNCSRVFAEAAAGVLAANGIKAYMYDDIVPVAALSFAVRSFGCMAGVMMTASHNPADYNGIKVYNAEGCQVMPDEQKKIYACIESIDIFDDVNYIDFETAKITEYFELIDDSIIEEYIDCIMAEKVCLFCGRTADGDCGWLHDEADMLCEAEREAFAGLSVLYTPLNGGGLRGVCEITKRLGIGTFEIVKSQKKPDGNFPTCRYPNPETDDAYDEALKIAADMQPDIVIATDPDCDRLGVLTRLSSGMYRKLSGNEAGIIILEHIINANKAKRSSTNVVENQAHCGDCGTLHKKQVAVRSLTASALADVIAHENNIEIKVIPNGSNYIGKAINELAYSGRAEDFIFAFEDTNQCISGTYTRDEDGVLGTLHILSAAAFAKSEGKNLADVLDDIYKKYGYFESDSVSIAFSGIDGLKRRSIIMEELRSELRKMPKSLDSLSGVDYRVAGMKIEEATDYMEQNSTFPPLDAIEVKLEADAGIIIRPSGTEPKLKLYMHAKGTSAEEAKQKCGDIEKSMLELLNI